MKTYMMTCQDIAGINLSSSSNHMGQHSAGLPLYYRRLPRWSPWCAYQTGVSQPVKPRTHLPLLPRPRTPFPSHRHGTAPLPASPLHPLHEICAAHADDTDRPRSCPLSSCPPSHPAAHPPPTSDLLLPPLTTPGRAN
jgi:hypothetical protein